MLSFVPLCTLVLFVCNFSQDFKLDALACMGRPGEFSYSGELTQVVRTGSWKMLRDCVLIWLCHVVIPSRENDKWQWAGRVVISLSETLWVSLHYIVGPVCSKVMISKSSITFSNICS